MTSKGRVISIVGGVLIGGIFVAGCGFTGIGGGKQIDSLSEDDRKQVCERTQEHLQDEGFYEDTKRLLCVATSAASVSIAGGDAAACEAAVSTCLKSDSGTSSGDSCADTSSLSSCPATISEFEDCIDEQIDAMKEAAAAFDCAAALSGTQPPESMAGPACMALAKKCPDYFSGQGEGT